jgi:hypothetical protein
MSTYKRLSLGALAVLPGVALAYAFQAAAPAVPQDWKAALDRVSADSLRGHPSFLASDLLEGRNTPSRGLNIAAEYIAAQYRRAALARGGDDGYFQTSEWTVLDQNLEGLEYTFRGTGTDDANLLMVLYTCYSETRESCLQPNNRLSFWF